MKSICVYCGSSFGRVEDYKKSADALADALIENNISLVYGGAKVGLMGRVADRVLLGNGRVIGVIPKKLCRSEIVHDKLDELIVVDTMRERKSKMEELAQGFIALPGGIGTMEELFEIMTLAQLGYHNKPVGALNVMGYYDKIAGFLEYAVNEKFIKQVHKDILLLDSDPKGLINKMLSYTPVSEGKWL